MLSYSSDQPKAHSPAYFLDGFCSEQAFGLCLAISTTNQCITLSLTQILTRQWREPQLLMCFLNPLRSGELHVTKADWSSFCCRSVAMLASRRLTCCMRLQSKLRATPSVHLEMLGLCFRMSCMPDLESRVPWVRAILAWLHIPLHNSGWLLW